MVDGAQSFDELGIVFPLFAAPIHQCSSFVGQGTCSVFRQPDEFCFIVDAILAACAECGHENLVGAGEASTVACEECQTTLDVRGNTDGDLNASYRAIATGRAFFSHDTELGTLDAHALFARNPPSESEKIDPPQEIVTLGAGFIMVDRNSEKDDRLWKIAEADLAQLLATPEYNSWQQSVWLVHCDVPMVYRGSGDLKAIENLPDAIRERIVEEIAAFYGQDAAFPDHSDIHYFTCRSCGVTRPHIDFP